MAEDVNAAPFLHDLADQTLACYRVIVRASTALVNDFPQLMVAMSAGDPSAEQTRAIVEVLQELHADLRQNR